MNDDSKYRSLPDFNFRSQYDCTPRPDKDVEAALRGEYDKTPGGGAGMEPGVGAVWMSSGPMRLR